MKISFLHKLSMVGLGLAMLFSCKNSYEEVNKVASDELQPYAETFNTEITYSENGEINSKLISPHIQRFQSDTLWTLFPAGMNAVFYDSTGNVESTMKAQYGIFLEDKAMVIAEKNVVIENYKGEKLNTEKLTWYQDSGIFVTREFVKITQPTGVIYGNGLRATQNFDEYEILEITGDIAIEE